MGKQKWKILSMIDGKDWPNSNLPEFLYLPGALSI